MSQKAVDRAQVWKLLEGVTRSYATNDLQRRADALIAALVYSFEAIEILEARIAELEREKEAEPEGTAGRSGRKSG